MIRLTPSRYVRPIAAALGLAGAYVVLSASLSAKEATPKITLRGQRGSLLCVTFSPDGKTLASASTKSVWSWDVATGKHTSLKPAPQWCVSAAFSPDGKTLALGRLGGTIEVWNLGTGKKTTLHEEDSQGPAPKVVFSPDGKTLASGGRCCPEIRLWDATVGKQIATLKGHDEYGAKVMAFAPDGKILSSAGHDGALERWDVATGKLKVRRKLVDWIPAASFSPDGKTLATPMCVIEEVNRMNVVTDKRIILWNVTTGKKQAALEGHTEPVSHAVFSPDGKRLASGGGDGRIKVWDAGTCKELVVFEGHKKPVNSLAFSPDGKTLASGSEDKAIKLWDVSKLK